MNRHCSYILLLIMLLTFDTGCARQKNTAEKLSWKNLAPIPDPVGFAGSFAGVAGGALLVAGGANFPDGRAPWSGGVKAWTDAIYVLDRPEGSFKAIGKLPSRLGYGASVQWDDQLILIGGSNETGHSAAVFRLDYQDGKISTTTLPDLPQPLANTCAARCGNRIYVAGGIAAPDSKTAEQVFLMLDMAAAKKEWKRLPAWPGPARMLAVAAAKDDLFYLFSGVELVDGNRRYLKDAYAYSEKKGWEKLADLPSPVAAAASPAYTGENQEILIFGGDDGTLAPCAAELKDAHPGFSNIILSFKTAENRWDSAGKVPVNKRPDAVSKPGNSTWTPVTTTLAVWNKGIVLPGGEIRPAVRTSSVLMAIPSNEN
ncbi:galactose oxidase [Pedobacter sp. SYP-B3415]|uniref:galactose oxidase n=1 Tax=Pedobacter sp. SYP-B3415 TaxID=2496641 RepID=UPI00101B67D6|nr:galactose oxidase [Pedobacter sp. SYP-B3415]